jgi:uncharacterized membrane protein YphA (DoxX/SURF4 family)
MPEAATIMTGLMLLVGGLSIGFGTYPLIGILILLAFMIPTTLAMHQFWTVTDPMQKMNEQIQFAKNMALIGALLMLAPLSLVSWPLALSF